MVFVLRSTQWLEGQWSRELDDRLALISSAMPTDDASCQGHVSIEMTMANWEIEGSWNEGRSTVDWWNVATEADEISHGGHDR